MTTAAALRWPDAHFTQIPYAVFHDPRIHEEEQARIFRGPVWNYLALEAEIPAPGDYVTCQVGDTPVVVGRDKNDALYAFVNRCAHRGATVCRAARGNAARHTCVYHRWTYDQRGGLVGVPFRNGIEGRGGLPADFDVRGQRLQPLAVQAYRGAIFGSFAPEPPDLLGYLDAPFVAHLDRVLHKPLKVLGYQRQAIYGNWKLYCENVRDPYHGGLLHLFQATFGIYRSTQEGGTRISAGRGHNISYSLRDSDRVDAAEAHKGVDSFDDGFKLSDPSILAFQPEWGDRMGLSIMSVFPNCVFQQIANSLATRQIRTRGPNEFELYWTYFGYADDDEAMRAHRLRQSNLAGPGGLISMEDGEAVELVHRSILRDQDKHSLLKIGGGEPIATNDLLVSEIPIRGFWSQYAGLMGVTPDA